MRSRQILHDKLVEALGNDERVYFQPPESLKLKYPCIIYKPKTIEADYADNKVYMSTRAYDVLVIYKDPDSDLPEKVLQIPYSRVDRSYITSNLYHDAFVIYN